MLVLFTFLSGLNRISIKTPASYLVVTKKLILKFLWKNQKTPNSQHDIEWQEQSWKTNTPCCQNYKATISRLSLCWVKKDKWILQSLGSGEEDGSLWLPTFLQILHVWMTEEWPKYSLTQWMNEWVDVGGISLISDVTNRGKFCRHFLHICLLSSLSHFVGFPWVLMI